MWSYWKAHQSSHSGQTFEVELLLHCNPSILGQWRGCMVQQKALTEEASHQSGQPLTPSIPQKRSRRRELYYYEMDGGLVTLLYFHLQAHRRSFKPGSVRRYFSQSEQDFASSIGTKQNCRRINLARKDGLGLIPFHSIPLLSSSSMVVANIYSYPGKPRQRNSVFPFCTACYVDSICSFSFQFLPSYLSSLPLSKAASRQLQCYIITASMQCLHCTCYYFIDSSFANIIEWLKDVWSKVGLE